MNRALVLCIFLASGPPAAARALECTATAGLAVDADGAPDSYRVDGKGLSFTCDGVFAVVGGVAHTQKNDPTNWQALCLKYWAQAKATNDYTKVKIVGFATDAHGRPIVQGAADPLPGKAYVTTTKLVIPGEPDGVQRRYVNASQIPYVVLSPDYARRNRLTLGELVAVYRPKTGRIAYGVYGDCCSLGEASVRLHQDLGSDPLVIKADGSRRAKRGIGDRVVFVALSGAHTAPSLNAEAWRSEIKSKGDAALAAVGGIPAVQACAAKH